MKSTNRRSKSVNSIHFSDIEAILDKLFQTNTQDKKRKVTLVSQESKQESLNSQNINPIYNNIPSSSQYDINSAMDSQKQPNTQESIQQPSQNNVYEYSSDSDSDVNIIEQLYSKNRPETSATVSQQSQQQEPFQKTIDNTYSQDNNKISERQQLSYKCLIDRTQNKCDDQQKDQSNSKFATKSPETQSIQQIFSQGPLLKYKLQCGPNYNIDEQKQLKYVNYTPKIIEGLKYQWNQDTCGQKKNGNQNPNDQLPTVFQCKNKDSLDQNNQMEKSFSKFVNNKLPLQQYPQEDIEVDEECDKSMSLRKKLNSNSKESLNSKNLSSNLKTQLPEVITYQGSESLMSSSFTLRKLSPKQNNFEKISRRIFQQEHVESEDDDDDEDGDEMEALKAIARKYTQQENRKAVKETSLDDSVSIIPCMNDITQILNQFQDKDKITKREEELNKRNDKINTNARTILKNKLIQKPERISGRVSEIQKLTENKTSIINTKRNRYQFYDNEEEENNSHWNGKNNSDDEESSSDYFQSDLEVASKGKEKNNYQKITNEQKAQRKQGFVNKDPKKKICLEKHKARVESSEEEVRKSNRQNKPTRPQRSQLSSTTTTQSQIKKNLNNSSNITNRFSGGNAIVRECQRKELRDPKVLCNKHQDKKSKKKQIVDSDEEFEAEMNRQKNLKKQKRDKRKIHKDEESSYSEQSQQIKEYNEEEVEFNEGPQYVQSVNYKREKPIQSNYLFDKRRFQLDSQRSQSQQQSQQYPKFSQILPQKQRIPQSSQNGCQSAISQSPPSQRMPQQQLNDIEKSEKKIKKKLVKAAHIEDISTFLCTICLDPPADPFFGEINCKHRFCFKCILHWSTVANQCPMCRTEFSQILKRNFNGTVVKNQPLTYVRRKKQKIHESYYLEEAQAMQDEEDRQAGQQLEPAVCYKCLSSENQNILLICDVCDENYCHTYCDETLTSRRVPDGRWACHNCRF